MEEIKFTVPIYYTQTFKTKKDKTFLVGMNWYNNAHYILKNQVKHFYHDLVGEQVNKEYNWDKVVIESKIYLKNTASDGNNVQAVIYKFVLDGAVEHNVMIDDNVKVVKGDYNQYFIDKENPRAVIIIKNIGQK